MNPSIEAMRQRAIKERDERAVLFDNPSDKDYFWGHGRQTINRPREYGMRYIHRF